MFQKMSEAVILPVSAHHGHAGLSCYGAAGAVGVSRLGGGQVVEVAVLGGVVRALVVD